MRTFILGLAVLVSTLAVDRTRAADEPPVFDIAKNCKEESGVSGIGKNCTADETEARNQLARRWSSFSASQKKECVTESRIGEASYVELLTCLQMASGDFGSETKTYGVRKK